jgi:multidrug transporter EmrE-like cation transporter
MEKYKIILLIVIASTIEYFGDSNFKFFARSNQVKFLGLGLGYYLLLILFLIYILKYANVIYANLIWDGSSAIIESILAYILLGERLNGTIQYMGGIFILIGMGALNYGAIPK